MLTFCVPPATALPPRMRPLFEVGFNLEQTATVTDTCTNITL
jgi:hypothetical protein